MKPEIELLLAAHRFCVRPAAATQAELGRRALAARAAQENVPIEYWPLIDAAEASAVLAPGERAAAAQRVAALVAVAAALSRGRAGQPALGRLGPIICPECGELSRSEILCDVCGQAIRRGAAA